MTVSFQAPLLVIDCILGHIHLKRFYYSNRVPQEERNIARYASISSDWQHCVERVTFNRVVFDLAQVDKFLRHVTPRRRSYIRHIDVKSSFNCLQPYNLEELKKLSGMTGECLRALHQNAPYQATHLSLCGQIWLGISALELETGGFPLMRHKIEGIISLSSHGLAPAPICEAEVMQYFPDLRTLRSSIRDGRRNDIAGRKATRKEFAGALETKYVDSKLEEIYIFYGSHAPRDEMFEPVDLTEEAGGSKGSESVRFDPLSKALGSFSQQLVKLYLHDINLNASDFFGRHKPFDWPRLEKLSLQLSMAGANGSWFFVMDPADEEDVMDSADGDDGTPEQILERMREYTDEDDPEFPLLCDARNLNFRSMPNQSVMEELYVNVARAITHMPRLESLHVGFEMTTPERGSSHEFDLARSIGSSSAAFSARWTCVPLFEPGEIISSAFHESAQILGSTIELHSD